MHIRERICTHQSLETMKVRGEGLKSCKDVKKQSFANLDNILLFFTLFQPDKAFHFDKFSSGK